MTHFDVGLKCFVGDFVIELFENKKPGERFGSTKEGGGAKYGNAENSCTRIARGLRPNLLPVYEKYEALRIVSLGIKMEKALKTSDALQYLNK